MEPSSVQRCLISEILKKKVDDEVSVRGKITQVLKKPNRRDGVAVVELMDNTGSIKITFNSIPNDAAFRAVLSVNRVLNVKGKLFLSKDGGKAILGDWKTLNSHGSIDNQYQKDEAELKEQQSRSIISRICRVVSNILEAKGYIEVSTKVLSREWNEDAFNLMEVTYPGIGTPVYLVPSPFSQLSDFLLATFNDKAFSVTSSFAANYRFPNSPTEMKIVYAVSMDKDSPQLKDFMEELHQVISDEILTLLSSKRLKKQNGVFKKEEPKLQVIADSWTSVITSIIRLVNDGGDVLMEGSEEETDGDMRIQTLVVYPTQYMGSLNMRQLLNYERFYDKNRHAYSL